MITEKDLDLVIPQIARQRSSSISRPQSPCSSPYFRKLSQKSTHSIPLRTTNIHALETLWRIKRQELHENVAQKSKQHMKEHLIRNPSTHNPTAQPRTIFNDLEERNLLHWSRSAPVLNCPKLPIG
ncbi:unnamed protein product [Schistosoma turkestanicum]|nr:unnamed protein product [Schistosoma turkestanicum]